MNMELEKYLNEFILDKLADAFNSHLNGSTKERPWTLVLRGRYNQSFDKHVLNTSMCIGWYISSKEKRITVGLGYHFDEKVKDFYFENIDNLNNACEEAIKYIDNLF